MHPRWKPWPHWGKFLPTSLSSNGLKHATSCVIILLAVVFIQFENEQGDRRNERGIETLGRGGGGGVVVEGECVEMAEAIVGEDVRNECKNKFKKFL